MTSETSYSVKAPETPAEFNLVDAHAHAAQTLQSWTAAQSVCWFCGQRPIEEESRVLRFLHRSGPSTSTRVVDGAMVRITTTTPSVRATLQIPRCNVCQGFHKREAGPKNFAVVAVSFFIVAVFCLVLAAMAAPSRASDTWILLVIGWPALALGAAFYLAYRLARRRLAGERARLGVMFLRRQFPVIPIEQGLPIGRGWVVSRLEGWPMDRLPDVPYRGAPPDGWVGSA